MHELGYQPDHILKEKFINLVQSTEISDGGHFAAFEKPKLLADSICSAVAKFQSISGINTPQFSICKK